METFNLTQYLRNNPLKGTSPKEKLRAIIRENINYILKEEEKEEDTEEEIEVEPEMEPDSSSENQEFMDTLEALKEKAALFNDEKLNKQIDNTITYFTRQHVVTKENLNEANEDFEGSGLIVIGRTPLDNEKISDFLEESDYYGIWNSREGYFFFPEEEDLIDNLERDLSLEFNEIGINCRFESQYE